MKTSTVTLLSLLALGTLGACASGDKGVDDTGGATGSTGDDGGDEGGGDEGGGDEGGGDDGSTGDDGGDDTGDSGDPVDLDGDGVLSIEDGGTDCDDDDATVYPGAEESCDAVDSDCDGDLVDDFEDLDRDGTPDCVDDDACAPAPDSLLIWLQGDDETDAMGTTTTMEGSTTLGFEPGIVGNAVSFDGESGAWDYSPDPWLVSPLSVEVWLKTAGTGETQRVLGHYECGGDCSRNGITSPSAYFVSVDADGYGTFTIRDGDAPNGTAAEGPVGSTLLTDGLWHHVVGVLDPSAGTMSLYVDGALDADVHVLTDNDGSGFAQDGDGETDPITIGWSRSSSTGEPVGLFVGQLDELSVYDGVLSDSDVAALHGAGLAGKCE